MKFNKLIISFTVLVLASNLISGQDSNSAVSLDSTKLDLALMDSLFKSPNSGADQIKVAFPFVWKSDLNGDDMLEFSEFQLVQGNYDYTQEVTFAVNYELRKNSSGTMEFIIMDSTNGAIVYQDTVLVNAEKEDVNALKYFSGFPSKTWDGKYTYKVLLITGDEKHGYFNELTFQSEPPPPPAVENKINLKEDITLSFEETTSRKEARKLRRNIRRFTRKAFRAKRKKLRKSLL